jgi:N-methylhydantoinase A
LRGQQGKMLVAFDIGGTFTDVIVSLENGQVRTEKVLSIHETIGNDISNVIGRLGEREDVRSFVHATTVCSNALIEQTVPPVAFVTTKGFSQMLELMNQRGPIVPDLNWRRLDPLIPQKLCFEVDQRILADGSVDRKISDAQLDKIVAQIVEAGVCSVAVCFLNSYLDGSHEEIVRDRLKIAAPDLPVCISSEINPEIGEFDRASTTVINALLVPVVNNYLARLQRHLNKFSPTLRIMQSNGGTMSSEIARQRPMTMVESGPAAGVLAAACVGRELKLEHVLSFDMGGTTAKACLIEHGSPLEKGGMEIGGSVGAAKLRGHGHPLRTPTLDIVEVGAGGGSIAWIDAAGALRVGPRSAGADPGPVCYSKGGTEPTVTDANVALGFINPDSIADNTLTIDRDAAVHAIQTRIAVPLGLSVLDAAQGMVDVANATMMRALRAVSTERGRDIRDLTLLAFGGSGPVHAVSLAERVGIRSVVIPPLPGVFSALGLLLAGDRLDYIRSIEASIGDLSENDLRNALNEVVEAALDELASSGLTKESLAVSSSIDLRYVFETSELNLPVDFDSPFSAVDLVGRFRRAHEEEYGFAGEGALYVARLRVRVTSTADRLVLAKLVTSLTPSSNQTDGARTRTAYFGKKIGLLTTPVLSRLQITEVSEGPLIVEEETTTIVIPPGWSVRRDALNNLLVSKIEANGASGR